MRKKHSIYYVRRCNRIRKKKDNYFAESHFSSNFAVKLQNDYQRMKTMWMLIFMVLPFLGVAYVAWHVWAILPLGNGWKWLVIGVGILCFLLLFLDLGGVLDKLPLWLARVLYEVGTSSIFVLLYLTMLFLLLDAGRLLHLVPRSWLYDSAVSSVAITGFMLTVFVCGNLHYYNKKRVPLSLSTTKPLAHNYRIVMMSDLHLGYHNTRHDLTHWVDLINAEQPNLVLIAGDIIDVSVAPLIKEDMAAELRRIKAPIYACVGNHEYYSQMPLARQFYQDAGIHLLCDSSTVIDSTLLIIGRDDRTNIHRKTVAQLVAQANTIGTVTQLRPYTILLDHQPYALEKTEQAGIDFQLSGHTHQGQVWPISWITNAIYECSWGSHRRGNTQYYVSSGLGIWGGKFRIGTQSEYVVADIFHKE